jgi:exosortase
MTQDFLLLGLLILVSFWIASEAWIDMITRALQDPENGQALFAPIIAAFLFWLRRSRLQFIRYRPSIVGPAVLALGAACLWWGIEHDILAVWHGGAVILLIGCILTMTGLETLRQFFPVILCLFFLIPTPGVVRIALAAPLQEFATAVTILILDTSGVQAVRDGNVIMIGQPAVPVAIGEACNGMRMVIALLLVVFGFVFSAPFRLETRVLLLALSPLIALTCNVIRLVPTSLVYGHASLDFALNFHWIAGLVMLPLALLILFGIVRLLTWLDIPTMSWRLAAR